MENACLYFLVFHFGYMKNKKSIAELDDILNDLWNCMETKMIFCIRLLYEKVLCLMFSTLFFVQNMFKTCFQLIVWPYLLWLLFCIPSIYHLSYNKYIVDSVTQNCCPFNFTMFYTIYFFLVFAHLTSCYWQYFNLASCVCFHEWMK